MCQQIRPAFEQVPIQLFGVGRRKIVVNFSQVIAFVRCFPFPPPLGAVVVADKRSLFCQQRAKGVGFARARRVIG